MSRQATYPIVAAFLGLLFFISSCSESNKQSTRSEEPIRLDDYESLEFQDLSIDRWVPLETVEENLIGLDLRIKYSDSLIFVMDESTKKGIHVFDRSGNYQTMLAEVGEGPGMLPSLEDFEPVNGNEIQVLSTVGDKTSVYEVSLNGSLSKLFELPYIAFSFARLEENGFLFYGSYNLPFVTHRLIETDPKGKIIRQFLENDYENQMLPMTERNFYPANSGVLLVESFNPEIYLFQGDTLSRVLRADFGNYALPAAFWEMDIMEGFGMINEQGFANFGSIYRQDSLMVADVLFQKGTEVFKHVLIQQGENRYKVRADRDEKSLFYFPIGIDQENRIHFTTYRSILEAHVQQFPGAFPMDQLPEEEYDYPVIIQVSVKEPT
ncbi:MAG: 6-bladed beta-propeller [Cyclobacterium sp.]|uniref:6-bladed beta-propeller n=1 Tax=Cyclobacterium sp. TaxID=1966343 RepID=UPI0039707141